MFQIKVLEKIKKRILCSETFFPKILPLMRKSGKNMMEPERPQMTIWWRVAYWILMATCAQVPSANAPKPTSPNTRTHARTNPQIYVILCNV